jgi:thioesterase III
MSHVEDKAAQINEAVAVAVAAMVRCTEIEVNGHLNNAKFVEYLEWGREEWYECHGFGYDRLEGLGAITVVVNISLNYRPPCHQGDRLRIVTRPQQRGRTSFALAQRIERSDGTVVADGVVTLVTVDSHTPRRTAARGARRAVPGPRLTQLSSIAGHTLTTAAHRGTGRRLTNRSRRARLAGWRLRLRPTPHFVPRLRPDQQHVPHPLRPVLVSCARNAL